MADNFDTFDIANRANSLSYDISKILEDQESTVYSFLTNDDSKYFCHFVKSSANDWGMYFSLDGETSLIANNGDIYKVMNTIGKIVEEFLLEKSPNKVVMSAKRAYDGDLRRYNVFKRYSEIYVPDTYDVVDDLDNAILTFQKK